MIRKILKITLFLLCFYLVLGLSLTAVSFSKQKKKTLKMRNFYDGFIQMPASYIGIELPKWWVIKWTKPLRK